MRKLVLKFMVLLLVIGLFPVTKAEAASNLDVVELAKGQLGVPYVFGGTSPKGFDCSGFLYYVFSEFDIKLPRISADQYKVGTKVAKADLLPGDLVFFENTYKQGISHSGIYIGDNEFISATSSHGIKIDSLDSSYWGPRFVYGKRLDSVSYEDFTDLAKDHPAYGAIMALNKQEIINGFENQEFRPENPVTRGQAAAILNRVLKLPPSSGKTFPDVVASSFSKDISAIQNAGIISGFPDGTFRPNEVLTRAQMAVIVQRAFKIKSSTAVAKASSPYVDIAPDYWAFEAIMGLNEVDKTTVFKSTNKFRAMDKATRADFSAAIYSAK